MVLYFIVMYATSLILGYALAFSRATLTIGRSISDTDSKTGFQDAITPPWLTKFSLVTYAAALGGIGFGWYKYGWLIGLSVTISFFFIAVINNVVFMPKSDSKHFRRFIIQSMISRYADYVKSGDELRASAMKTLLEKLDIPVSELEERMSSRERKRDNN